MKEHNTRKIGKEKEDLAVSYLEKRGYKILERNFFMRGGEIDIIATRESTIIFVEVKYRNTVKYGSPEEAVTYRKQLRIAKTALYYIKKRNISLESSFRFDVIVISGTSVSWITNAFDFPEALGF